MGDAASQGHGCEEDICRYYVALEVSAVSLRYTNTYRASPRGLRSRSRAHVMLALIGNRNGFIRGFIAKNLADVCTVADI